MRATQVANRVLSAVLAIALLAAAVIVVAEVVLAWLGQPPWLVPRTTWDRWLSGHSWDDSRIIAILIGLCLLGLLLLVLGLRRGKPRTVALGSDIPAVQMMASRRSLERSVASAAARTPAVADASASASRRSVKVKVRPGTRHTETVQQDVSEAVRARLADLGLPGMSTKVRLKGEARL